MLTIFSCPKAFVGHAGIIQLNAIKSWTLLNPRPEIILFGDDAGTAKVCAEFGLRHEPKVRRGPLGTPFLNDIYFRAAELASGDILCYVNADIIFGKDLVRAIDAIKIGKFVMCGRRWDLDVTEVLDFSADWEAVLSARVRRDGVQHGFSGIDYLAFPRAFQHQMPDFYIGRPGWDNWFLWKARNSGCHIIDASADVVPIHQRHDYSHSKYGTNVRVGGPEFLHNISLTDGCRRMLTIRDSDIVLAHGAATPANPLRRLRSYGASSWIVTEILSFKRRMLCNL